MLTRDDISSRPDDKEFMATLAKGLAVLGCFGRQRPAMTLSEAALAANVSRATAAAISGAVTPRQRVPHQQPYPVHAEDPGLYVKHEGVNAGSQLVERR